MSLRRRYYIAGGAAVVATVLILIFFLINSYQHTVRLVKERFFVQQALTTRQTALSIEKNFTLLERESQLLAVVMPKKSGKEAYEELRSRWGEVNVLFLSGYAPDLVHRAGLSDASFPFLQKPVARKVLLKKVRELLETEPRRRA